VHVIFSRLQRRCKWGGTVSAAALFLNVTLPALARRRHTVIRAKTVLARSELASFNFQAALWQPIVFPSTTDLQVQLFHSHPAILVSCSDSYFVLMRSWSSTVRVLDPAQGLGVFGGFKFSSDSEDYLIV
jgi:hypothetical protein